MHADPQLEGLLATPAQRGGTGMALAVGVALAAVLALYFRTTLSMVSIWERSETFAHGFVVIPIFLYLVWRKRDALGALAPTPNFFALAGIAIAGALWLLGERLSAAVIEQFAMMAMVPLVVWAVLGTRVARTLSFPLAFLFFAVPFGEVLVPTLMDWTADFTVFALRVTGVPVYREGNYFMIPSGNWSIVEACSGLRYLIASLMVGSLFAYLSYRSAIRRAVFVGASLLVPIVANWMRAYIIVMLGHLTNNRIAAGADHLIYGWIFFGVVMAILFWIGARWREDIVARPASNGTQLPSPRSARIDKRVVSAALAAFALAALWQPLYAALAVGSGDARMELQPLPGSGGWNVASGEISSWRPDVSGANAELRQTFERAGIPVGLHIAFFGDQTRGAKAVTSGNQLVSTTNKRWKQVDNATVATVMAGAPFRPRAGVVTDRRERLATWQWFWVDGHVTGSELVAKWYEALAVLQGHGDPVAWVIVYTPGDRNSAEARATLQAFTADMWGSIDAALARTASR